MTEAGLRSGDTDWHGHAVRLGQGAGRVGAGRALFALRGGPEPSVRRRQPVSRPDQDRPVPDAHIPGRTDIPGRRRARRGRARAQAGRVLAALPRQAAPGDRTHSRRAWRRAAVGSALHRQRAAAPVRGQAARPEHRHGRRRQLRARRAGRDPPAPGGRGATWAVNGRFKGGHITRHYGRPGTRCTRCSWRCASRPTWTRPIPTPTGRNWRRG